MKRAAGLLLALASASGCLSSSTLDGMPGGGMHGGPHLGCGSNGPPQPPALKNAVGPWGTPVPMVPPVGPHAPGATGGMGPEIPFAKPTASANDSGITQTSYVPGSPALGPNPGMNAGKAMPGAMPGNLPGMIPNAVPGAAPGMMPGAMPGMPGGMMPPGVGGGMMARQGMVYAAGAVPPGAGMAPFSISRTQVRFAGPAGAKIGWFVAAAAADPNGKPVMLPHQLDVPGRYNFLQASIYRLKLSDIPGRPGLELYPTLEVVPCNSKTEAFLAHNYVPVEFTEEDFDQVTAGNYLTKVVYLPDNKFQSPLGTGPEELTSTRLEAGADPIAEAHRRGHILLVVRLGGVDLETANTPPLDNAGPYGTPRALNPNLPPPGTPGMNANLPPAAPGIAPAVPPGQPSQPPTAAPPAPRFNVPSVAPNGPIVPAPSGTLPLPVLPGTPSGKAPMPAKSQEIQQAGYVVGSDGQLKPVAIPKRQQVTFPQVTIPRVVEKPADTNMKEKSEMEDSKASKESSGKTPKKGLFGHFFKSEK